MVQATATEVEAKLGPTRKQRSKWVDFKATTSYQIGIAHVSKNRR